VGAVFCNNCGHKNPDEANFCSSCGSPLERTSPDATTTITLAPVDATGEIRDEEYSVSFDELPEGACVLIVKRGPNAGSRYVLEHEVTRAGRHPDSDIFLDDVTVSRRHAEFHHRPDGYVVRDVGSLNGTYLNRERIDESVLSAGDEVQIGKFKLVFLAEAAPEA
jgi:hypothetical protein